MQCCIPFFLARFMRLTFSLTFFLEERTIYPPKRYIHTNSSRGGRGETQPESLLASLSLPRDQKPSGREETRKLGAPRWDVGHAPVPVPSSPWWPVTAECGDGWGWPRASVSRSRVCSQWHVLVLSPECRVVKSTSYTKIASSSRRGTAKSPGPSRRSKSPASTSSGKEGRGGASES